MYNFFSRFFRHTEGPAKAGPSRVDQAARSAWSWTFWMALTV